MNGRAGPKGGERSGQYRAFLSYAHEDRALAAKVHRFLERYSIPRQLVGRDSPYGPIPKRLYPIFMDDAELSSGLLSESIVRALENSTALIVLCSEHVAGDASPWVNREIEQFARSNDPGRIHTFCASASLAGSRAPESLLPRSLLDLLSEQLRCDTSDLSVVALDPDRAPLRRGCLRLIAGLLGVSFESLVQRDRARSRLRAGVVALGVTATVLLLVATWQVQELRRMRAITTQIAEQGIDTSWSRLSEGDTAESLKALSTVLSVGIDSNEVRLLARRALQVGAPSYIDGRIDCALRGKIVGSLEDGESGPLRIYDLDSSSEPQTLSEDNPDYVACSENLDVVAWASPVAIAKNGIITTAPPDTFGQMDLVDLAISRDGTLLAARGRNCSLLILDVADFVPRMMIRYRPKPSAWTISTDRDWPAPERRDVDCYEGLLEFDPSGVRLFAMFDGHSVLLDLQSRKILRTLDHEHSYSHRSRTSFSPDGRYLATSGKAPTDLMVLDASTGAPRREVRELTEIAAARLGPGNGRLSVLTQEGLLRTADLVRSEEELEAPEDEPAPISIQLGMNFEDVSSGIVFPPDASIALVFGGERLAVVDLAAHRSTLNHFPRTHTGGGVSSMENVLVADKSRVVIQGTWESRIVDLPGITAPEYAIEAVDAVFADPEGQRLVISKPRGVLDLIDLESGHHLEGWWRSEFGTEPIWLSAASGLVLAVQCKDEAEDSKYDLTLLDLASRDTVWRRTSHVDCSKSHPEFSISPGGRFVAIGEGYYDLAIHDTKATAEPEMVSGHANLCSVPSFSRDESRMVFATYNFGTQYHTGWIDSWTIDPGRQIDQEFSLVNGRDVFYSAQLMLDGSILFTSSEEEGIVGVLPPLKNKPTIRVASHGATGAISNASGDLIAVTGRTGQIRLLRRRDGRLLIQWGSGLSPIGRAEFAISADRLLTLSSEGRVRIWDLTPDMRPFDEISVDVENAMQKYASSEGLGSARADDAQEYDYGHKEGDEYSPDD